MFGYVGGDDGREWLVYVEPERRGVLRRARADAAPLVAVLHQVLVEDLEAEPQWFTDAEWNDTRFGRGNSTPT